MMLGSMAGGSLLVAVDLTDSLASAAAVHCCR
jgi:hypothetical protein